MCMLTVSGSMQFRPPSSSTVVTVTVVVITLLLVVVLAAIIVVGFAFYQRKKRRLMAIAHSLDRSRSISSNSSHYSGKNDDTPDLVLRRNGRGKVDAIELTAQESYADASEVPFKQSGEIRKEDFAAHVEKFDEKRQLLFQEEFDVRRMGSYIWWMVGGRE